MKGTWTKMPEEQQNVGETTQVATATTETISEVTQVTSAIDFDNLTEEQVLAMTEEQVTEVKAQVQLLVAKVDTVNGYLKALAWKAFKAKFTWANFKALASSAWVKIKSWLSNLDPIARYAIYALILAKLFNFI